VNIVLAVTAYEPGTVHIISYDPQDPAQVNTYLTYSWMAFRPAFAGAVLALLFIAGGVIVKNWANGRRAAS
jgi:hypothetical protein